MAELQTKTPRPPDATRSMCRVCGIFLVVEALAGAWYSLSLIVFGGIGVVGLAGAFGLAWSGIALYRGHTGTPKSAAIGAIGGGGAVSFALFGLLLLSNCGIMGGGCSQNSGIVIFGVPVLLLAFNLLCGVLLWRMPSDSIAQV